MNAAMHGVMVVAGASSPASATCTVQYVFIFREYVRIHAGTLYLDEQTSNQEYTDLPYSLWYILYVRVCSMYCTYAAHAVIPSLSLSKIIPPFKQTRGRVRTRERKEALMCR